MLWGSKSLKLYDEKTIASITRSRERDLVTYTVFEAPLPRTSLYCKNNNNIKNSTKKEND